MIRKDPFAYWRARGWRLYVNTSHDAGMLLAHNSTSGRAVIGNRLEEILQRLEDSHSLTSPIEEGVNDSQERQ